MKGTLIKRSKKHYDLYTDKGLYTSNYQWTKQGNLLSLKNCQAIENGYDLDELSNEFAYNQSSEDSQESFAKFAYIEGFQKAMELMDKKYSEEHMINFSWWLRDNLGQYADDRLAHFEGNYLKAYIQSLQHNEWEVEIFEELDKDGCLILKQN